MTTDNNTTEDRIFTYRVGTYNVKNLFDRITDFAPEYLDPLGQFETSSKPRADLYTIAQRINDSKVDTLALQEIESYKTLMDFKNAYLSASHTKKKRHYPSKSGVFSMPSNDNRGIDLGVLSSVQFPIGQVTSHRFRATKARKRIFSRDCLQVDILFDAGFRKGSKPRIPQPCELPVLLTLFICHFKSKYTGVGRMQFDSDVAKNIAENDIQRSNSLKRSREIKAVAEIIQEFDPDNSKRYIVLGDFNDTRASAELSQLIGLNQFNTQNLPKDLRLPLILPEPDTRPKSGTEAKQCAAKTISDTIRTLAEKNVISFPIDSMNLCASLHYAFDYEKIVDNETKAVPTTYFQFGKRKKNMENKELYSSDSRHQYSGSAAVYPAGGSSAKRPYHTHKWKAAPKYGRPDSIYTQIDYLLLSRKLCEDFSLVNCHIEQDSETSGSDHYLYWTEFEFNPKKLFGKRIKLA